MELVKSLKTSKIIKYAFFALIGSITLAISSKIKIPFYPVPMTMQTLVVVMIGLAFGWKLGLATISLYLFEGLIGLPVFSGTPEKGIGFMYFTGPTMGYLIGFLITVFFVGKFSYDKNLLINFSNVGQSVWLLINIFCSSSLQVATNDGPDADVTLTMRPLSWINSTNSSVTFFKPYTLTSKHFCKFSIVTSSSTIPAATPALFTMP